MVKITFELDENLNIKFRKAIASSKGLYRGAIQEALIESINLWIKYDKTKNAKVIKKNKESKKNDGNIPNIDTTNV